MASANTAYVVVSDPYVATAVGRRVGRFVVTELIGPGRWGVVYRAYDPQLDRPVRISVSPIEDPPPAGLDGAKALARLQPPNLCRVLEVDHNDVERWVVSEVVGAESLERWRARASSWRARARVAAQVCRAVATAHAAGLDPFGLAHADVLVNSGDRVVLDVVGPTTQTDDQREAGRLIVELFGRDPDASARPWVGLPRAVAPIVQRALASGIEDRFADLDGMASALERIAAPKTAGLWALGGLGVVAAAAWAWGGAEATQRCSSSQAALETTWNPARKAEVGRAFATLRASFANEASDRVQQGLDAFGSAWVQAHTDACEATHVKGEQSEALLDRRMGCLSRQLREFDATLTLMTSADKNTVLNSVELVEALPNPAVCADWQRLASSGPPPEHAARIEAAEDVLFAAIAAGRVKRLDEAIVGLEEVTRIAEELGYQPLLAEALLHRGYFEMRSGALPVASQHLLDALAASERADMLETRALALSWLVALRGYYEVQTSAAEFRARHAEALLERAGHPPEIAARLSVSRGVTALRAGQTDQAEQWFRRAIEEAGDEPAAQASKVSAIVNLGIAYGERGRHEEARETFDAARELSIARVGPNHPDVAAADVNLATTLRLMGKYEEALDFALSALEIRELTLGADHYETGLVHANIGLIHKDLGHLESSETHLRRALAIDEATVGADHHSSGYVCSNLADTLRGLGRLDEALAEAERAVDIFEKRMGPAHRETGRSLLNLGQVHLARRDHPRAEATLSRALSIQQQVQMDPGDLALTRFYLAEAVVHDPKRRDEARALVELARTGLGRHGRRDPIEEAEIARWLESHPPRSQHSQ